MKVEFGIAFESLLVALLLAVVTTVPSGMVFAPIFFVVIQFLLTYFSHCPAHYVVGSIFGIRFRKLLLGKSALRKSSSSLLRLIGKYAFTFVLIVDKDSLARASPNGRRAMFLAGVTASTAFPFVVTFYSLLWGSLLDGVATTLFAISYLLFDGFYSPRAGDVYRARRSINLVAQSVEELPG